MRWNRLPTSRRVEDRRGRSRMAARGGGLGIGTVLVLGLLGWALGVDPRLLIAGAENVVGQRGFDDRPVASSGPPEDEIGRFVAAVLGSTEQVFGELLPQEAGIAYDPPRLVMFSQEVRSGCGLAGSATGPFYCPSDETIYIDTSFFGEMDRRLGGGGDFAYAYVIAHEVGHHVENELGLLGAVRERQQAASQSEANALSVRIELMADCLAGVWAHHAEARWSVLEPGDVEEAVSTAAAIGDDRLQESAGGRVVPDSFTHGSSEQRRDWLVRGLESGEIAACDTFG